jgi:hypothetical protein
MLAQVVSPNSSLPFSTKNANYQITIIFIGGRLAKAIRCKVEVHGDGLAKNIKIDRAIGCNPASSKQFDPALHGHPQLFAAKSKLSLEDVSCGMTGCP